MSHSEEFVKGFYTDAKPVLYTSFYAPHSRSFGENCLLVHTEFSEKKLWRIIAGKWVLSEAMFSIEDAWASAKDNIQIVMRVPVDVGDIWSSNDIY